MNLTQAKSIIGSIGYPSKLPGTSYGLSAYDCIVGKELAKIPRSICSTCYALRDRATWTNAQKAYARRLKAITHPFWIDAMVLVLTHLHRNPTLRIDLGITGQRLLARGAPKSARYRYNETGYHRWHDSGDIQSLEHFEKIVEVCRRTPHIQHWIPTRELAILRAFKGSVPSNCVIRVSASMLNALPPATQWCGSAVHTGEPHPDAYACPARHQGNSCGNCRACWNGNVPLVSYVHH